jgi:hypothetical protein
MAVKPSQTVLPGLVVREVPAATYAVFSCAVSAIGQTYASIFGEWRAKARCEVGESAPAFEQYPPADEPGGPVRIHIPVLDAIRGKDSPIKVATGIVVFERENWQELRRNIPIKKEGVGR